MGDHERSGVPEVLEEDLLRALCEEPEVVESYLVYADWLQTRGDPRGELITLQHQRELRPHDQRLASAEQALLRAHRAALVGELEEFPELLELDWRLGFIRAARFRSVSRDRDPAGTSLALLEELLAHPSARFLSSLEIGNIDEESDLVGVAPVLVRAGPRARLRNLVLGELRAWLTRLDLSAIWPLYRGLQCLRVEAGLFELGVIVAPQLRSFELQSQALSREEVRTIAAASLPQLERLVLVCRGTSIQALPEDLHPLLERGPANLHELSVVGWDAAEPFFEMLVYSPLAARLTRLDLSHGSFSDASASLLLCNAQRFPRLQHLNLEASYLRPAAQDDLRGLFPEVVTGEQCEPPEEGGTIFVDRLRALED